MPCVPEKNSHITLPVCHPQVSQYVHLTGTVSIPDSQANQPSNAVTLLGSASVRCWGMPGVLGRQWQNEVGCAAFREKHRDLLRAYAPPAQPQDWPPNPSMQVRPVRGDSVLDLCCLHCLGLHCPFCL